ncbi:MAG: hypothetical protein ABSG95_11895 [Solirubrobacteraceae bacterium]|jgi:hypothetical protein
MLFILIPIVWLAVATFIVAVCRSAADGDDALIAGAERSPSKAARPELVLREQDPARAREDRRLGAGEHARARGERAARSPARS